MEGNLAALPTKRAVLGDLCTNIFRVKTGKISGMQVEEKMSPQSQISLFYTLVCSITFITCGIEGEIQNLL